MTAAAWIALAGLVVTLIGIVVKVSLISSKFMTIIDARLIPTVDRLDETLKKLQESSNVTHKELFDRIHELQSEISVIKEKLKNLQ